MGAGHGRFHAQVLGAVGDFSRLQLRMHGQIGGHPRIDHLQRKAVLARKHIDGRATGEHVGHHLHRHGLRKGGHTFGGNAVVGGEHHHLRRVQRGRLGALDQAELQRQAL